MDGTRGVAWVAALALPDQPPFMAARAMPFLREAAMSLSQRQREVLTKVVKAAPILLEFGGRYAATIHALEKRGLVEAFWTREPRISTGHKWIIECRPTQRGVSELLR